MKAWHFAKDDKRLGYGDGREIIVGETLKHDGGLVLCSSGLHASIRPIDALGYARGAYVCRVELGGEIIRSSDKAVASERTVIWAYNAAGVLRRFARLCALDVIDKWDAPEIVVRYLKTGDESIRDAAGDAAWDAAGAAARDAAGDAARAAARAAARDAAGAAARDKYNTMLEERVLEAWEDAQ